MLILTPRLELRPPRSEDLEALIQLWTDPIVTEHIGGPRDAQAVSTGLSEDLHLELSDTDALWPVFARDSGMLVGHCGLLEKQLDGVDEVELTYVIARRAWGRGYATEIGGAIMDHAETRLGLRRVIALIAPANDRSIRVASRLGFKHERDVKRLDPQGVEKTKRVYVRVRTS